MPAHRHRFPQPSLPGADVLLRCRIDACFRSLDNLAAPWIPAMNAGMTIWGPERMGAAVQLRFADWRKSNQTDTLVIPGLVPGIQSSAWDDSCGGTFPLTPTSVEP